MAAKFFIIAFIALIALTAEGSSMEGPLIPSYPPRPDASGRIFSNGYEPVININPVNNAESESYSSPETEQYAAHNE